MEQTTVCLVFLDSCGCEATQKNPSQGRASVGRSITFVDRLVKRESTKSFQRARTGQQFLSEHTNSISCRNTLNRIILCRKQQCLTVGFSEDSRGLLELCLGTCMHEWFTRLRYFNWKSGSSEYWHWQRSESWFKATGWNRGSHGGELPGFSSISFSNIVARWTYSLERTLQSSCIIVQD
jgi:hypothetical protein